MSLMVHVFNIGVQQAVSDTHAVPLSIGGPMSIQLSWKHLPGPEYMWYFICYLCAVLQWTQVSSVQMYGTNDAYQNMTRLKIKAFEWKKASINE